MLVGLLSDTHGARQMTAAALRVLEQAGAEVFVHCGDVGGEGVLDELAGRPAWVVLGNTDDPEAWLLEHARRLGLVAAAAGPMPVALDGRTIQVFHGYEFAMTRLLQRTMELGAVPADFGRCDYLVHGHTHIARDLRVGPVRVINPGALYRTALPTVAVLDLATDDLRFLAVEAAT